ncbi:hypothetical protein BLNAU_4856 [Blattamonas nauphoetae]|uniref:Uncharacterized protein n=1 Tax=Blattamonas nauphoetae TaxID=2049346 RepID=A0ABQ9Y971_9EUKA|nr:hypothetical protein BLNAU_4856 [Blattamonas nauphoetae]
MGSSTSISIISCRHTSSSCLSSLLPLVTGPTRSFSSKHTNSNEEAMEDTFGLGTVSISGSGLSIESTHFVVGTGPLFDFGHFAGDSVDLAVECVVSLSASEFVNATSTRDSSFSIARRMWLTQRLVGSSVTRSTNHFSGTSGIDLNWGADTLVSNCSFSHIVTNAAPAPVTEPPTPSDMSGYYSHSKETKRFSLIDDDVLIHKPVWIESCTFDTLTAVLVEEKGGAGGAVLIVDIEGDVVIKHSSFMRCTAEKDGGAVYLAFGTKSTEIGKFDLTIFACQFSENTAVGIGGHCHIQSYKSTIIAQCTFSDSRSTTSAPLTQYMPINIVFHGPSRIDNCTISNNEGTISGGAYVLMQLEGGTVDLTDVLFIKNNCTSESESDRITDFGLAAGTGTFTAYDCFSTSALPRSGLIPSTFPYTLTSVLPDLVGPTINKIDAKNQVNSEDTGFEVVVKMEGMLPGTTRKYDISIESTGTTIVTKGVRFDKTSGTMTIPMSTSSTASLVPSTAYTITEVKSSSSESKSNTFEVGDETEPDWTWWHHTPESRADNLIGMSFETPSGPSLTLIGPKLNPSNLNEVILTLTAARVATGPLTLIVFDTSDPAETPITVGTVSFATTPTSSVSTTTTVTVHQSGKLAYGKTYKVKSIESSLQILTFGFVSFTVPAAPARLTGATTSLVGVNKTFVTVSMDGQELPAGKAFSIVVKEMEGNVVKPDATPITLSGTIGGSSGLVTSCSSSVEIYNKTGTVEYGKKYQIVSLTVDGKAGVADSTASFTVPDSPCRIEGTGTPKMNGEKTEVSVEVIGVSLSSSITAVTVRRGSTLINSKSVSFSSSTQIIATFATGVTESTSSLAFDGEYEIHAISGLSESFINAGVNFTVPSPPRILSASTELDTSRNTHFKMLLIGKDLMSGTVWKMKLTGRDEEILVTMTGTQNGESEWVKAGGPTEIEFDCPYTIASLTKSSNASEHIVSNGVPFTTPVGPTLTDISADLDSTDANTAILTLTAKRIATGDHTLDVFDTADLQETALSVGVVSFSVSTAEVSTTLSVVVHPSGLLAYGKTYKVKLLSSSAISFACSSVTFQMPAAPARLTKASATLVGTAKTSVQVSMEGQELPAGKALSIVVKEMEGNVVKPDATPITLSGTIGGSSGLVTSCSASVEIYNKTGTVEYGKKYQIMSLTANGKTGVADSTASFIVPDSPCRIEGTETPTLNGAQTEVSVVVTGVSFSSSITAVFANQGLTVIGSKSLKVDSDTQMTAVFNAGLPGTGTVLEYEVEYEINAINAPFDSFINVGVKFTVPSPPRIISASTELDTTRNTHFKVLLTGKNLIPGTVWKMKLTDRNEEISVTMTGTQNGESEWVKAGGLNEIEFDQTYTLYSLIKSNDASEHIVCNGVSFTTPAGSTLTDISADLDPSNLNETILTLTAERIAKGDLTLEVFDAADSTQKSIALGSVSFSTSTTPVSSTISVVIRPSGKLAYGGTYKVKTLSSSSLIVSHSSLSVQIPSLIITVSCSLDLSDTNTINLFISAIGLPPSSSLTLTVVEVDGNNNPIGTPFTIDGVTSLEEGEVTHNLPQTTSQSTLQQGNRYKITKCEMTNHKSVVDGNLIFTVPLPPVLTAVPFSFASSANTSFRLVLEGTDLPAGETFLVTLNAFPNPIEVTFETTTTGSSAKLPIGELHIFQYRATYSLVSVIHKDFPSISIPCTGLSFTTGERPSFLFLHVSSSGNDENEGIGSSPLRTLHKALVKTETESIESQGMIIIADSCSIGELTEFGSLTEEMEVTVEGGEGRKIICSISEMEKGDGKRMGQQEPMISLKRNTLSFSKLIFEMKKADSWIGSVFLVTEEGVLSLESSEVRSSETISHRFVWIEKTGLFEGKELAIASISFGGKGSVMAMNEAGRLRLAACSFEGLSFASGGVVVGKTEGDIQIEESVFSKCAGREFGSVIRLSTGGGLSLLSSRFLNCSTEVRFSEKSSGVMGGGSVVIEIDTKHNTRSPSSSQIDLSDCVFSGCRLRSTEGSGWSIGGSGFAIVGGGGERLILRRVQLSNCSCVGLSKMVGFSGGVCVWKKRPLFVDSRGLVLSGCSFGSIELPSSIISSAFAAL